MDDVLEHTAADNWRRAVERTNEPLPGLAPSLGPHIQTIIRALERADQALRFGQIATASRNIALAIDTARLMQGAGR